MSGIEMMNEAALTDYVYCDQPRLDSYFEQISETVAYDKVPVWKAGLSFTGLTAEGTQIRPGRQFTMHEKVQRLVEHLRANDLVASGRLTDWRQGPDDGPFRVEAMSARRATIPTRASVPGFPGLGLWVSVKPDANDGAAAHVPFGRRRFPMGALFLIETIGGKDRDPRDLTFSGYSWLALLVTVLDESFQDALSGNAKPQQSALAHDLDSRFTRDPIDALSRLGAIFAPPRRIAALYRVRAACAAREHDFAITTIGYPIVVTGDGGVLELRS